jgi:hypothetical protein
MLKQFDTFFGGELGINAFNSESLWDLLVFSFKTGPSFSVKNGFFSKKPSWNLPALNGPP